MNAGFEHIRVDSEQCYDVSTTENSNEFKLVQLYINRTDEDLCIIHRNNLPMLLKKSTGYFNGSGALVIRNVYHFNSREQVIGTINNLQNMKKHMALETVELEILLTVLLSAFNNDRNLTFSRVTIDKEVPIKTIRNHSAVYVHEADLLICDSDSTMKIFHPFSNEGMLDSQYRGFIEERKVSGIFLELIDNENQIKTRYMYVAKQLIEIPARQDKSKASGLYFTRAEYDFLDNVHIEPTRYGFDEAELKVGLYKTKEEAITGGNPELLSRTEEERVRRELLELKVSSEREKTQNETTLNRLNHELQLLVAKNKQLAEELEERKHLRTDEFESRRTMRNDYYEERSYDRKDTWELFKLATVAVVTGLGVYAAMMKADTKKKIHH